MPPPGRSPPGRSPLVAFGAAVAIAAGVAAVAFMALSPSGAPAGQVSAAAGGAHDLPSDVPSAPDVQAPDPSPPGNATGVPPLPTPPLPDLPQP